MRVPGQTGVRVWTLINSHSPLARAHVTPYNVTSHQAMSRYVTRVKIVQNHSLRFWCILYDGRKGGEISCSIHHDLFLVSNFSFWLYVFKLIFEKIQPIDLKRMKTHWCQIKGTTFSVQNRAKSCSRAKIPYLHPHHFSEWSVHKFGCIRELSRKLLIG